MNGSSLSVISYRDSRSSLMEGSSVTPAIVSARCLNARFRVTLIVAIKCQVFYFNKAGKISSSRSAFNNTPTSTLWNTSGPVLNGIATSKSPKGSLFVFYKNYTSNYGSVHLFAEGNNSFVQEYTSTLSQNGELGPWRPGFIFPNSADLTGVSGSLNGTYATLSLTSNDNYLNVWQRDVAISNTSNAAQKIGEWTQGKISSESLPSLQPT